MSNRKVFHDSVIELPEQPGPTPSGLKVNATRPEQRNEKMMLSFSLAIPQTAHDQLEAAVAKGEVVSLDDLNDKYAVPAAEVDPLIAWLKNAGYEIVHVSKDRTSVFARATAAQIETINVGGGPRPPTEGEETLDAEWSSGVAPGANVRIYASGSLQFSDLDRALDSILTDLSTQPGMRQLSISLGLGETFMTPGDVRTQHQKLSLIHISEPTRRS